MIRTILAVLLLAAPAAADAPRCPPAVTAGALKAFPGATIGPCKAEREGGRDRFELKLTTVAGDKLELDVAPDGAILQVEQAIAVDALPQAVRAAFAARYPKARAAAAQKQTAGKDVRYEIAFATDKGRKEATFAADGAFVEEE